MALPPTGDTIAAISTAPGTGAVGIVRISGPSSLEVADALFVPAGGAKPSGLPANRATFGRIVNGATLVDEAIMLNFRAPRSYTGQDVIELQTHGGPAVLRQVLELAVSHVARLAGPGAFPLRAVSGAPGPRAGGTPRRASGGPRGVHPARIPERPHRPRSGRELAGPGHCPVGGRTAPGRLRPVT